MEIDLRYGRSGLSVTLPDRNLRHVLRLQAGPALADVDAATRAALAAPLGSAPLGELARGRRSACVVLPDSTRPLPGPTLLPPLLAELHQAGLQPADILLLVATGLHRVATAADWQEIVGPEIAAGGYRMESHQARDAASHELVGHSRRGTPILLDRRYRQAELRVLVSLIEPHLFAGYSGGRKMILPGLASAETICRFHCPEIIEHPHVEMGRVCDNPADEEAWDAYRLVGGADFAVACTLDEQRRVTWLGAGETRAVQIAGMTAAERAAKVVLEEPADIVVTSNAGYPLDRVFYQGLKAICVGGKVCRPGGYLIVAQANEEGVGSEEFADLMLSVEDCHRWVRAALTAGGPHGVDGWALHQIEQVTREHRVLNFSTLDPDLQRRLGLEPMASVEAGVAQALAALGPEATITVLPEGPYVLPCLRGEYVAEHSVPEMMAAAAG
ncbi:MAG TPA: nickel-dependent lactate racemase [Armatimonadota bacterium]|jgi:nickel-dependent lactate racemase